MVTADLSDQLQKAYDDLRGIDSNLSSLTGHNLQDRFVFANNLIMEILVYLFNYSISSTIPNHSIFLLRVTRKRNAAGDNGLIFQPAFDAGERWFLSLRYGFKQISSF